MAERIRRRDISIAESSSRMHADHSPLRSYQILVDTALEGAKTELSNAVSTSAWKPPSGVWLAFKSQLESAAFSIYGTSDLLSYY